MLGRKDYVSFKEDGAAFHLAVLAFYQLSWEAGDKTSEPIEIEKTLKVNLFKKDASGYSKFTKKPYIRYMDIVIKGSGEKNDLIEVKSKKAPFNKNEYVKWNWDKAKTKKNKKQNDSPKMLHRQFFLDRVATADRNDENVAPTLADDFKWWFHGFDRPTIEGYKDADIKKAAAKLTQLPKDAQIATDSLGGNVLDPNPGESAAKGKLKIFNLKNVLLDKFRKQLFADIDDEIYDELITNSKHDQL